MVCELLADSLFRGYHTCLYINNKTPKHKFGVNGFNLSLFYIL